MPDTDDVTGVLVEREIFADVRDGWTACGFTGVVLEASFIFPSQIRTTIFMIGLLVATGCPLVDIECCGNVVPRGLPSAVVICKDIAQKSGAPLGFRAVRNAFFLADREATLFVQSRLLRSHPAVVEEPVQHDGDEDDHDADVDVGGEKWVSAHSSSLDGEIWCWRYLPVIVSVYAVAA